MIINKHYLLRRFLVVFDAEKMSIEELRALQERIRTLIVEKEKDDFSRKVLIVLRDEFNNVAKDFYRSNSRLCG